MCKPHVIWNVCLCVVVCGGVWLYVVLLVASVLALMRWLLCGGDGLKKKKTKSVILKISCKRIYFYHIFALIQLKTALHCCHYSFNTV